MDMDLAQPLFLLLLPLPWLWLRLALRHAPGEESGGLCLRHPQLAVLATAAAPGLRTPARLRALAFCLLLLALSQPRLAGEWITPPPDGRDIALVIDTSLTMSLDDFSLEGRKATRLAVLKVLLDRFIAARGSDRFALLAFGSEAALLTPPTFDQAHVRAQLRRLQVGIAGNHTALGDALGLALQHLKQQRGLRPAVILVSDGEPSNTGDLTPAEAVAVARASGAAIHTLQVGSDLFAQGRRATVETEPQPALADIARLTGGQHWDVRSTDDASRVIAAISALEQTVARPVAGREQREAYWLPLLMGAACLLLAQLWLLRRTA
jgi:Ca-activated chloride channel family protein